MYVPGSIYIAKTRSKPVCTDLWFSIGIFHGIFICIICIFSMLVLFLIIAYIVAYFANCAHSTLHFAADAPWLQRGTPATWSTSQYVHSCILQVLAGAVPTAAGAAAASIWIMILTSQRKMTLSSSSIIWVLVLLLSPWLNGCQPTSTRACQALLLGRVPTLGLPSLCGVTLAMMQGPPWGRQCGAKQYHRGSPPHLEPWHTLYQRLLHYQSLWYQTFCWYWMQSLQCHCLQNLQNQLNLKS
jgi:hypothetical protein